jgi:NADPH:quinone reductase-like Zn-dependent oxidoreductase
MPAAVHTLGEIGELIESGRFSLPVAQTFPLAEVAEAHRVSEQGHVPGSSCCWSADAGASHEQVRSRAAA